MRRRPRIAVVDDDRSVRHSISLILASQGVGAIEFASGFELFRDDAWREVDGVVLDMLMPGMSGLEVLRRLRQLDSQLPVIMVTGGDDPELEAMARCCGVSDYMLKPFDVAELLNAVRASVDGRLSVAA